MYFVYSGSGFSGRSDPDPQPWVSKPEQLNSLCLYRAGVDIVLRIRIPVKPETRRRITVQHPGPLRLPLQPPTRSRATAPAVSEPPGVTSSCTTMSGHVCRSRRSCRCKQSACGAIEQRLDVQLQYVRLAPEHAPNVWLCAAAISVNELFHVCPRRGDHAHDHEVLVDVLALQAVHHAYARHECPPVQHANGRLLLDLQLLNSVQLCGVGGLQRGCRVRAQCGGGGVATGCGGCSGRARPLVCASNLRQGHQERPSGGSKSL